MKLKSGNNKRQMYVKQKCFKHLRRKQKQDFLNSYTNFIVFIIKTVLHNNNLKTNNMNTQCT